MATTNDHWYVPARKGPQDHFAHSDMVQECQNGRNHYLTCQTAYRNYDKVAAVADCMVDTVVAISGRRDNVVVVENVHDYKKIRRNAEKPVCYQPKPLLLAAIPAV